MDETELRKRMLRGRKTDRLSFAVTPELKHALEAVAEEECVSVSSLISQAVVAELANHSEAISKTEPEK